MSWGGPGGLTGAAAEEEDRELQGYLRDWIERGIFRSGEVIWDPQEGRHWVRVDSGPGWEWSAEEFRAYVQGVADVYRHLRGGSQG